MKCFCSDFLFYKAGTKITGARASCFCHHHWIPRRSSLSSSSLVMCLHSIFERRLLHNGESRLRISDLYIYVYILYIQYSKLALHVHSRTFYSDKFRQNLYIWNYKAHSMLVVMQLFCWLTRAIHLISQKAKVSLELWEKFFTFTVLPFKNFILIKIVSAELFFQKILLFSNSERLVWRKIPYVII